MTEYPALHEPGDVRRRIPDHGHGHACRACEGNGTVRQRGRPAGDRVSCRSCGGSGQLRPAR